MSKIIVKIILFVAFASLLSGCEHAVYESTSVLSLVSWNSVIYAGTEYGGIYSSSNDGLSWKQTGLKGESAWLLAASESTIYAVVGEHSDPLILYRSNNGKSWKKVGEYPLSLGPGITLFFSDGALYTQGYLGAYRSKNEGKSWDPITLEEECHKTFALASSASRLYISADVGYPGRLGLFRSEDGGKSWVELDTGFTGGREGSGFSDPHVCSLLIRGSGIHAGMGSYQWNADKTNYIYEGPGILYSGNWGDSWTRIGLDGKFIEFMTFLGTTLYAAGKGPGMSDYEIFRLRDGSDSWEEVSTGLMVEMVDAFPKEITAFESSGSAIYAGTTKGIYRLKNGEDAWELVFFEEHEKDFYFWFSEL